MQILFALWTIVSVVVALGDLAQGATGVAFLNAVVALGAMAIHQELRGLRADLDRTNRRNRVESHTL